MYCKRVVILQQSNARFAERGKELCGMVKFVNRENTEVTVFVTNADVTSFGEWWIMVAFTDGIFAKNLSTFNNFVFTLPLHSLDEIGCLLVKREDDCYEVAQGQYGTQNLTNVLRRNIRSCEDNSTPYEKFVASTENFYEGADVEKLKADADGRYKSVEEYSNAFERYYAAGGQDNYYQSVKREIGKVFLQFPPYYPLIRKYRESFFVRIDFPSSAKYFVLGLLQQEGKIRYICYGLPAEKEGFSDKDFVFVNNAPTNFWMLFQDADTGQITTLTQPV